MYVEIWQVAWKRKNGDSDVEAGSLDLVWQIEQASKKVCDNQEGFTRCKNVVGRDQKCMALEEMQLEQENARLENEISASPPIMLSGNKYKA